MQPEKKFKRHELEAIMEVKQYIDLHPLEWKSTESLAADVLLNRNVLQQGFKRLYGTTISEYQAQKRMEAAASMLEEGRLTKKQIASKCGYHKPNNFSSAFRKIFKMTPSDWQNENAYDWPMG